MNYIELFVSDVENESENIKAFVNICSSFASQTEIIDFTSFFDSLVKLFQLPPEQHYKNLVGLFGELSVVKYFFSKFKEDLSMYWHTDGGNSRIDIVTPNVNIEIKTTTTDQLVFTIKHTQLFENPEETYLAAVSISENNSGKTINELMNELLTNPDCCNSLSFAINIEEERRKISPKDAESRRFVLRKIRFYNSKRICPFPVVPNVVSDLSYKIDLSGMDTDDFNVNIGRVR